MLTECRDPMRTASPRRRAIPNVRRREKGAHQDVAELHVPDDDAPQAFSADFEDRPVLTDARGHERLPPSQHVELADELAATFRADQLLTEQGDAQDVGRALEHDVEVRARLPLLDENLTACDGKFARAGRDAGDLRFVELREELVLSLESSWRVEGEHHGEMDLGNEDAGRTPAEGDGGGSIMGGGHCWSGSSDDGTGTGTVGTVIVGNNGVRGSPIACLTDHEDRRRHTLPPPGERSVPRLLVRGARGAARRRASATARLAARRRVRRAGRRKTGHRLHPVRRK